MKDLEGSRYLAFRMFPGPSSRYTVSMKVQESRADSIRLSFLETKSSPPIPNTEIEVIAYKIPVQHWYRGNDRIPAWRLMLFHHPMEVEGPEQWSTAADSLFLFPPYEAVSYGPSEGRLWSHSWIRFSAGWLIDLLSNNGIRPFRPYPVRDWQRRCAPFILEIIHEPSIPGEGDPHLVINLLEAYCRRISKLSTAPKLEAELDGLISAKHFMETHFTEHKSLEELAAKAKLSRSHFCTAFKKAFGKSPGAYLKQLRINWAKQLLKETHSPIREIASLTGYQDEYYFARVFKGATGTSATDYRCEAQGRTPGPSSRQ